MNLYRSMGYFMISENRRIMKITLTEEQFQLIHQYLELVRTINEAFTYVVTGFDNLSYTEGNVILGDIFTALQKLEGTNAKLIVLFHDHDVIKDALHAVYWRSCNR